MANHNSARERRSPAARSQSGVRRLNVRQRSAGGQKSRAAARDPLASLIEEHRIISEAFDHLEAWLECIEAGEVVETRTLQAFVFFLTDFVDAVHHEKEESILLPALARAGVDWASEPMIALRGEHDQERYLVRVLHGLAHQTAPWSSEARRRFVDTGRELAALQRKHMQTERSTIYDQVHTHLAPAAQDELRQALADFDARYQVARHRLLCTFGKAAQRDPAGGRVDTVGLMPFVKRPVFAIRPEMKVGAALDLAAEHGVHHLPVLVSDALMGMVCTCDLVDHPLESSVTRAIRTPLVSVPVNASAGDALALMIQTGVGSLIVLDDGQPFGIVTRGDLLASDADPRLCCRYCGSKEHLRVDGTDAMACVDCADRSRPPLAEDELGGSG